MRVLVTRRWPEPVERALAERFEVVLNAADEPLDQQTLAEAMGDFDVLCPTVSDRIDAAVIAGGKRVRLIANYGVGFDHIDLAAAKAKGIAVTNTPGVLTDATADIAMTLLLMAARRAGEGERELRAGRWSGWRPTHLVGTSLGGKVLGLVGFGRIGIAVARRAHHGFGMRIAYHGRREAEPAVVDELGARFYPDASAMLAACDAVSLHVPGGAETAGLIGRKALATMKPGSILINTARGSVVDHDALAEALASGHLAGAGLDVYPQEPHVPQSLLALENVVLLPHLGSADAETRTAMGMKALANVEAFVRGESPPRSHRMNADPIGALIAAEDLPEDYRGVVERHWRPLGDELAHRARAKRPLIVGINGAQGSGKSTLCRFLEALLAERGLRAVTLSLDDLYLTRAERQALARDMHPLLATRGVPGTHDVALGAALLDRLVAGEAVALPCFDKACDDRSARTHAVEEPADVVLFEGWCVGAAPQPDDALAEPINRLEREEDPGGTWRRAVNQQLATDYTALFSRLDLLVMLRVEGFESVRANRLLQEQKLARRRQGAGVMDEAALGRFLMHYERLTRWMLQEMPARADILFTIGPHQRPVAMAKPFAE